MAINAGVNISKAVAFVALEIPTGVDISKAVAFIALEAPNLNPPVWPAVSFGDGYVTVPYSQSFDLYPAASPTTYTVVAGALPTGLALSNVSDDVGKIDGTPTVAGAFSFTLRATNAYGTADKAFTLTISLLGGGGGSWVF